MNACHRPLRFGNHNARMAIRWSATSAYRRRRQYENQNHRNNKRHRMTGIHNRPLRRSNRHNCLRDGRRSGRHSGSGPRLRRVADHHAEDATDAILVTKGE